MKSPQPMTTLILSFVVLVSVHAVGQESPPKSQGQATNEIELWTAQIRDNRRQIETVQKKVSGLGPAFRTGSDRLKGALDKAKKDPTGQRDELMGATIEVLDDVSKAIDGIVSEKEATLIQATQIEERARTRAGEFRGEAEKIDISLPKRQSEVADLRAKANEKKDLLLKNPKDRDIERELRKDWFNQRRVEATIENDQLRSRVLASAAQGLLDKAEELQHVHDGLESTFDNLEMVSLECDQKAKLLSELRGVEREVGAFGGRVAMGKLMREVGELRSLTADLNQVSSEIMQELIKRRPQDGEGGPLPAFDSDFNRWLNERN